MINKKNIYYKCHLCKDATHKRIEQWEEDILFLQNFFLDNHPYLISKPILCTDTNTHYSHVLLFDETKHNLFINSFQEIKNSLEKHTDDEIIFQIQKTISTLNDSHSSCQIPFNQFIPISFEFFFNTGGLSSFYAISVPKNQKELLFAELVQINHINVENIIARINEYISSDNEQWKIYNISNLTTKYQITNINLLKACNIIKSTDKFVSLKLKLESGDIKDLKFRIAKKPPKKNKRISHSSYDTLHYLASSLNKNYWTRRFTNDTFYFRISAFYENEFVSLLDLFTLFLNKISKNCKKLIIDLRNNNGGKKITGYDYFIDKISSIDNIPIIVLVDNGTASLATMMAIQLKNRNNNITIIGNCTGSGTSTFAVRPSSYCYTPNRKFYYQIGTLQININFLNQQCSTIKPDLIITQTIEDLKNGEDTVLNFAINY